MRYFLLLWISLSPLLGLASENTCQSSVTMTMQAEQWVEAKQGKITLSLKGSTRADQITQFKAKIDKLLQSFYPSTDWHVLSDQHKLGDTGLLNTDTVVVNTIPVNIINQIYTKVTNTHIPGLKVTVQQVDYAPDLKLTNATLQKLRQEIYASSIQEAKSLSATYAEKFIVQNVYFNDYQPYQRTNMLMGARAAAKDAQAMNTSHGQKMDLTARVTFATGCQETPPTAAS